MNDNLCDTCNVPETSCHFLLTCKQVNLYWKIISCLIRNIFDHEIRMNERVLIVGHDIGNKKMELVNLILNFAQFIIYRNYIKTRNEGKKHQVNTNYLLKDLKAEIVVFLSLKSNHKRFDSREMELIHSFSV